MSSGDSMAIAIAWSGGSPALFRGCLQDAPMNQSTLRAVEPDEARQEGHTMGRRPYAVRAYQ